MQITKAEVIPIELHLRKPVKMAGVLEINHITSIFIRIETRKGESAWGCTIAHNSLNGEKPEDVIRLCRECASLVPDLHPTNIEFSLNKLASMTKATPAVMCAFDLAFHDLLGISAGMPLYRILGGYRNRVQTSITLPLGEINECVDLARSYARRGYRLLKIKGGIDPEEDVRRVKAIHNALPDHILCLDADGGYTVKEALDVAHSLENVIEILEQPTPASDFVGLRQVKELSPVPILADQSLKGPASALELAAHRIVDGVSIKLVACGGLGGARQIDAITRAARMTTMVSCFIEPALLITAGLSMALSSPNVHFVDLDGHLNLKNDPSKGGFFLEDGWLIASDVPGLGYQVELG